MVDDGEKKIQRFISKSFFPFKITFSDKINLFLFFMKNDD